MDGCIGRGDEVARQALAAADPMAKAAVRCCTLPGDSCVSDKAPPSLDCFPASATFAEAEAACSSESMRLCTLVEMEAGVCCSTGCTYDSYLSWTSSPGSPPLCHQGTADNLKRAHASHAHIHLHHTSAQVHRCMLYPGGAPLRKQSPFPPSSQRVWLWATVDRIRGQ